MKTTITRFAALGVALAASASAGTVLEGNPVVLSENPRTKEWWGTLSGYGWVSAVEGDIGLRGLTAPADVSMKEVLEDLDFAYMGFAEIGFKRWSLGVDVIYARLSSETPFQFGPIGGRIDLEQEQAFVTARVQYRALQSERLTLDVFGGVRWSFFDVDADVRVALSFDRPLLQRFNRDASRRFDLSEDWVDPIVGFRGVAHLTPSWFLQFGGDIGGFGVASDLTWQAVAGIGYHFTPAVSALVGYRALAIDYDRNGFKLDTISHGPAIALAITF